MTDRLHLVSRKKGKGVAVLGVSRQSSKDPAGVQSGNSKITKTKASHDPCGHWGHKEGSGWGTTAWLTLIKGSTKTGEQEVRRGVEKTKRTQ